MDYRLDYDFIPPNEDGLPLLIFIHGAGFDKTIWHEQSTFFQKLGWGVVIPSLPNHGLSSPIESLNMQNYVDSISNLITSLKLTRVNLIGHSMGGGVVLQLVLQLSNSIINKIILIGTGAKINVSPVFFELLESDFNLFLELMAKYSYNENTTSRIKIDNEKVFRQSGAEMISKDFRVCQSFDIRSKINEIHNQTLILCGQDDMMMPIKYSSYLHEHLPHSQLVLIPNTGHYVYREAPIRVNKLIQKFILENT
ncbi:MAG: alpha/beta fold hydrolase [Candidatus Hodarchaeales archaeon]|jgi:pimeloyl-ACP methyl ester carboxylesterase